MTTLNARQRAFVDELYSDPKRNAVRAYMRVYGCTEMTAKSAASRLSTHPQVVAAREVKEQELRDKAGITAEEVVLEITRIAKADPRELFEYRRGACRYCHGAGHQYQRTPREVREALAFYATTPEGRKDPCNLAFAALGGVGFNPNKPPHPDCPECFGHGEGYEYIKDSRHVSAGAARLFAGLHKTKDGLKIITRNQDKMIELSARLHKLLGDKPPEDDDKNVPPAATVTYAAVDASKAPE